jgi:hypothetical protein
MTLQVQAQTTAQSYETTVAKACFSAALRHLREEQYLKAFNDLRNAVKLDGTYRHSELFKNAIVKFMSTEQTQADLESFIGIFLEKDMWRLFPQDAFYYAKPVKETFLTAIKSMQDPELQKRTIWQALSPVTFIGNLFYIQCGYIFKPGIGRGSLYQLAQLMQTTLSNETHPNLKIEETVVPSLRLEIGIARDWQYYFPELSGIVEEQRRNIDVFTEQHPWRRYSFYTTVQPLPPIANQGVFHDEPVREVMGRRHSF